jgi:A/G-specific adenine glycosylase
MKRPDEGTNMATDATPLDQKISFFREKLIDWAVAHTRDFPWRVTADPYQVCVAEVMLHQTGANKVAPVYKEFINRYPTLNDLRLANIRTLNKLLHSLGFLYRARRLKELAKYVVKNYEGKMPSDPGGLATLPGVGEYTASAIMCFAYGKHVPIIDANVIRVYSRFFGLHNKLPSSSPTVELKEIAQKTLPEGKARSYNYALLDFAATICSHYNPGCPKCPVAYYCDHLKSRNSL